MRKNARKQLVKVVGTPAGKVLARIKAGKKAKLVKVTDLDKVASDNPWDQVDRRLDLGDILAFIRGINPKIGQVLSLALTGLSSRQIASTMCLSRSDVDRAFSSARDILRGAFQGMFPESGGT